MEQGSTFVLYSMSEPAAAPDFKTRLRNFEGRDDSFFL